jgi:drug/metabolite transporter (DMT)-like permease
MYYFLYAIALVCLSQASVIIRWSGTDPLILGAWRLLFAGLILFSWSKVYLPHERLRSTDHRKIIAAGFAFFVHLFSYAYSAHHTSISHLMLIFSLNPVTTAMGSWLFFKEKMTRRQAFAYVLALVGIYILAREKQGSGKMAGDMMAVVAAITFSAYALLSKWARRDLSNSVFASRMYFAGSAFFFITAIFTGLTPPIPSFTQGWMGIGLLTIFPTLLGHGVFTLSMKHIPLPVLSLGKLIEPAMAAVTAYLLFSEQLSKSAVISFVVIIAAVALVLKRR